jgi:putative ABC transport system substrate-binding protein
MLDWRNRVNEETASRVLNSRADNLKSKIQNRKWMWLLAIVLTFLGVAAAHAQKPTKVARIGYLTPGFHSLNVARTQAFRLGLRELGYVEGKNIVFEFRYAEGKPDRLPALAAELLGFKPDVIVTGGGRSTGASKEATSTIPIVMTQDTDPVGNGFVASLARPGGNITGLSNLVSDLSGKRLELLKEIVPKLSRVAVLGSSSEPGNPQELREAELTAGTLGVHLQSLEVRTPKDIETAFEAASKGRSEAVLVLAGSVFSSNRRQVVEFAVKSRLPAMYINPTYVEDGGLMSYGASITEMYRRAATYVDKILKGAKPADLPVEQPTKFELVINLETANQIGLPIPPSVLARADRVIK